MLLALLALLLTVGGASAQININANGDRPGGSPNKIKIEIGSSAPINGIGSSRILPALQQLQVEIDSMDETYAYEQALIQNSCPLPNAQAPTQVVLQLTEQTTTVTQNVTGEATAFGILCKPSKCGKRTYEKPFKLDGTLTAQLRGVSEEDLLANISVLTRVAQARKSYRIELVRAIGACNVARNDVRPDPDPTPDPNISNSNVNNVAVVTKENDKDKDDRNCTVATIGGGAGGAVLGAVGAGSVAKSNRGQARIVGGIVGGITGAFSGNRICEAGGNNLIAIGGGSIIGGTAGTTVGFFYKKKTTVIVDPGPGDPGPGGGGPIRVCNGLPCTPIRTITTTGNDSGNGTNPPSGWTPVVITNAASDTGGATTGSGTGTTTTGGSGNGGPVRVN